MFSCFFKIKFSISACFVMIFVLLCNKNHAKTPTNPLFFQIFNFDELNEIAINQYSDWKRILSLTKEIFLISDI